MTPGSRAGVSPEHQCGPRQKTVTNKYPEGHVVPKRIHDFTMRMGCDLWLMSEEWKNQEVCTPYCKQNVSLITKEPNWIYAFIIVISFIDSSIND